MIDDISIHIIEIYRGTQDRKLESQVKTPGEQCGSQYMSDAPDTQYRGVRVKMWGKLFKRTIDSKCLELKISWWSEPTIYTFSPVGPCPLLPFLHTDSGLQMPIHSHCSTTQHHPLSIHDSVLGYASHLELSKCS